ncbi:MAG: helix-turn-helix transcriptional regulator [Deltaproteobacteria bacterium]|nr:helix-turn-helix transcriptional regulator [Deltaproteobacteria bacterium]
MASDRMKGVDRKQAIIEAARPLFAQNGFNGTSVRAIAKAAGVSEALLYKHFPSKEDSPAKKICTKKYWATSLIFQAFYLPK